MHYASGTGQLRAVWDLASRHGLRVVEDAAHAFGCLYKGRPIGSAGDIVCFSFQGTKNITSGEGGAVVTADPAVAERVRDLRLLDVLKDSPKRYRRERSWEFDVEEQGWRYHMSDLFAALGRVQLRRFPQEMKPLRVNLGRRYQQLLAGSEHVRLLDLTYGDVVPHIFPIYITNGSRDQVREELAGRGIETGIHYKPNHLLTMYGGGRESFPVAEALYEEMLTLPLHPALTEEQQDEIVECRPPRHPGGRPPSRQPGFTAGESWPAKEKKWRDPAGPPVSLLMPTWNGMPFIEEAIDSIVAQTFRTGS